MASGALAAFAPSDHFGILSRVTKAVPHLYFLRRSVRLIAESDACLLSIDLKPEKNGFKMGNCKTVIQMH